MIALSPMRALEDLRSSQLRLHKRRASPSQIERRGPQVARAEVTEPLSVSRYRSRHTVSSPIGQQPKRFMLAPDATMQIHFIDILAIAAVKFTAAARARASNG
jgi:hypothetical protein